MSISLQHGKRDTIAGLSDTAADVAMKARTSLDADMEISAVEILRDATLCVDTGLGLVKATLDRTLSEASESQAETHASALESLKDQRVCAEVY